MRFLARISLGFLAVGLPIAYQSRLSAAVTTSRSHVLGLTQAPIRRSVTQRKQATPLDINALLSRALGAKLRGYVLYSFVKGDLSQDKRPDFIALFRSQQPQGKNTSLSGTYACRVAVVLNQGGATLKLAAVNDNLIECLGGCAYQRTVIKGSYFSFESTQGDCDKNHSVQTFHYSKERQDWLLYKESSSYSSCRDSIPQAHDFHERTSHDFGTVTFANAKSEF